MPKYNFIAEASVTISGSFEAEDLSEAMALLESGDIEPDGNFGDYNINQILSCEEEE